MKVLPIVLALLMAAGIATAETTTGSTYGNSLDGVSVLNHTHGYDQCDRGAELGLGLDITVYEFEGDLNSWGLDAVEVQQKFDLNNSDYSLYGVVQCNIWKPIKKILGK